MTAKTVRYVSCSSVCICRNSRRFVNYVGLNLFSICTSSHIPGAQPLIVPQKQQSSAPLWQLAINFVNCFNAGQRQVFDKVFNTVLSGVSTEYLDCISGPVLAAIHRHFFLDAPCGTGKTFLTTAIQHYLKSGYVHVQVVASSAVAA